MHPLLHRYHPDSPLRALLAEAISTTGATGITAAAQAMVAAGCGGMRTMVCLLAARAPIRTHVARRVADWAIAVTGRSLAPQEYLAIIGELVLGYDYDHAAT